MILRGAVVSAIKRSPSAITVLDFYTLGYSRLAGPAHAHNQSAERAAEGVLRRRFLLIGCV